MASVVVMFGAGWLRPSSISDLHGSPHASVFHLAPWVCIWECCCKIRKLVGPKLDSTFGINFFDQMFKVYEKPEPS